MINRHATAVWKGTGKDGSGKLTTQSNVLSDTQYSYLTRFESGNGTNPEELIAAAHAGCFAMKLSFDLNQAGFTADELDARATVSLDPAKGEVVKSHIVLSAKIPGIDEAKFKELVAGAEKNCPISKLLKAEVSVEASLA